MHNFEAESFIETYGLLHVVGGEGDGAETFDHRWAFLALVSCGREEYMRPPLAPWRDPNNFPK
jgi:hypothetical protein